MKGFFAGIGTSVAAIGRPPIRISPRLLTYNPIGDIALTIRKTTAVTRSLLVILMLLALPGYRARTAEPGLNYDIVATDGAFTPAVLTALPGEWVHITVHNQGRMNHSIVFILPQGYIGIREVICPIGTEA